MKGLPLDVLTWQATVASAEGPKGYTLRLVLLALSARMLSENTNALRITHEELAVCASLSRRWVVDVAAKAVREGWITRQLEPGAKKAWAAYVIRPTLPDGRLHSSARVLLGPDGLRAPNCSCGRVRIPNFAWCQTCKNAYQAKWRQTHPLTGEARMKSNARAYANVYQRRGKLRKERCWECGAENTQKHHEDYSKPLQVVWLCPEHHRGLHAEARSVSHETKGGNADHAEARA